MTSSLKIQLIRFHSRDYTRSGKFGKFCLQGCGVNKLPSNLKPEFTEVPFVFFPQEHRLLFHEVLSPNSASKLVERILRDKSVKPKVDEVNVHVIQDKQSIGHLLERRRLKKIAVSINRPNADDLADIERRLEERFKKTKATTIQEIVSSDNDDIVPDEELKNLCDVAATNGRVDVQYRNEAGITEHASSIDSPKQHVETFSPEQTTAIDVLFSCKNFFTNSPRNK